MVVFWKILCFFFKKYQIYQNKLFVLYYLWYLLFFCIWMIFKAKYDFKIWCLLIGLIWQQAFKLISCELYTLAKVSPSTFNRNTKVNRCIVIQCIQIAYNRFTGLCTVDLYWFVKVVDENSQWIFFTFIERLINFLLSCLSNYRKRSNRSIDFYFH